MKGTLFVVPIGHRETVIIRQCGRTILSNVQIHIANSSPASSSFKSKDGHPPVIGIDSLAIERVLGPGAEGHIALSKQGLETTDMRIDNGTGRITGQLTRQRSIQGGGILIVGTGQIPKILAIASFRSLHNAISTNG